ncbi:MAG: hypothetical protein DWQ41_19910 [Planctomycetota bacterium]|nr:MAG: hypothetical protein DWQ41_19910 [Planctomycetota bacterium]
MHVRRRHIAALLPFVISVCPTVSHGATGSLYRCRATTTGHGCQQVKLPDTAVNEGNKRRASIDSLADRTFKQE